MKIRSLGFACSMLVGAACAYAQDSLVGTYSGSYPTISKSGNTRQTGVKLVIDSVQDGLVKGTASLSTGGQCSGNYAMEGKHADGKLVMKTTVKGGAAGDCSFSFDVAVEGNKLVGATSSGRPLTLSK